MFKKFKPLTTLRFQFLKRFPQKTIIEFKEYVQYFDQEANELIKSKIIEGKPLMLSKFGTVELATIRNYKSVHRFPNPKNIVNYIKGLDFAWWWETTKLLSNNAGVFPETEEMAERFSKLILEDIKEIDLLGSYLKDERDFSYELKNAIRINLNGYYTPFLYENPWTEALKGKKVLVIHPFEESIRHQYKKRKLLFKNSNVLPEFELITLKAVQSIGYQPSEFDNWFEALDSMKDQIKQIDFDVALIGCGAYGMPLAAYVKRIGKQAIHLAGWTQILFGISGRRWEVHDTQIKHLINEYWIHPLESEKPKNFMQVEDGCYW